MTTNSPDPQVLVIGVDPHKMGGGFDPAPVAQAIEAGMAKLAEHDIAAQACLFGIDGSDDPEQMVTAALRERPWKCVVVGVGLRKAEPMLELFEQVVNLSRQHAPDAAIAFNAAIPDFYEAAARWLEPANG